MENKKPSWHASVSSMVETKVIIPFIPLSPLQCSSSIAAPSSNTAPSGVPLNPVQPSPSLPGHSFNLPFENWVYQAQAAVYRYTCVHVHVYVCIYHCICTNVRLCRLPTDIHCIIRQCFVWENMCITCKCMQLYIAGSRLHTCTFVCVS